LLAPAALRPALAVVAFASLAGGLWVVSLLGGVAVAASLLLGDWAEVDGAGEVDWLLGEAALALVSGVVEVALLLGAVVVLDWLMLDVSLELFEGVFAADDGGVVAPAAPVELEPQ